MSESTNKRELEEIREKYLEKAVQVAKAKKKIGAKPSRVFYNSHKCFSFVPYVAEVNKAEKLLAKLSVSSNGISRDKINEHSNFIYEIFSKECRRLLDLNSFLCELKVLSNPNGGNSSKEEQVRRTEKIKELVSTKEEQQAEMMNLTSNSVFKLINRDADLSAEEARIAGMYGVFYGELREKNGRVNGLYYTARTFEGNMIKNLLFKIGDEGMSLWKMFKGLNTSGLANDKLVAREELMKKISDVVNSDLFQGFMRLKEINAIRENIIGGNNE